MPFLSYRRQDQPRVLRLPKDVHFRPAQAAPVMYNRARREYILSSFSEAQHPLFTALLAPFRSLSHDSTNETSTSSMQCINPKMQKTPRRMSL